MFARSRIEKDTRCRRLTTSGGAFSREPPPSPPLPLPVGISPLVKSRCSSVARGGGGGRALRRRPDACSAAASGPSSDAREALAAAQSSRRRRCEEAALAGVAGLRLAGPGPKPPKRGYPRRDGCSRCSAWRAGTRCGRPGVRGAQRGGKEQDGRRFVEMVWIKRLLFRLPQSAGARKKVCRTYMWI